MVTIPVRCPHCHSTEVIKASKQATGANAISVKTTGASGGSFSSSTTIAAAHLRSVAKWLTWPSTGAAFATPPAYCGSVPPL